MIGLAVQVIDEATPALERLAVEMNQEKVRPLIGRAAANFTRAHFYGLDRSRANKLGGRRTHFYAQAARSTNFQEGEDGVTVAVNHVGIRQRIQGGRLQAGARTPGVKYLTIPASAEAYGKRAREFDDLVVVKLGEKNRLALARKGQKGQVQVMYWLVPSFAQQGDASVAPDLEGMKAAALQAVRSYFARVAQRGGRA